MFKCKRIGILLSKTLQKIIIKYTSSKQISIEDFNLPFGRELSKENRWARLALDLPWDEIISVYLKKMSIKKGRRAVSPRIANGALIIKHMKSLSDEATVDEIRENPYLQYFLGYEKYSYDAPFTPSLFVSFRRCMGKNEFDAKTSISLVSGFCFTDRVSWDAYNEGGDLKAQVESYRKRFGHYPAWVSGDTIYGNRENRAYLKEKGIRFSGSKLGRPSLKDKAGEKQRKNKARQRSEVEGKFGEGKRSYNLDCIKAKRAATSESWIGAVFFVMNIAHWMRVIFLSFSKKVVLQLGKAKTLTKRPLIWLRYSLGVTERY